MDKYKVKGLFKHTPAKIGLLAYAGMWLFTALGALVLPLDVNAYEPVMANLSPANNYLSFPKDINIQEIQMITSGTSFSMALQKDGSVISWGGKEFNQEEVAKTFQDKHIQQIAAGANHVIAVDENNEMYEVGNVPYAQNPLSNRVKESIQVEGVQKVFASDTYSGCLTNTGYLYYWGNTTALNLNEVPEEHQGLITNVVANPFHILYTLEDKTLHIVGRNDQLSEIPLAFKNHTLEVLDMQMNYSTILILDTNHQLHMWGDSIYDIPNTFRQPVQIVSGRRNFHILYEDESVIGIGNHSKNSTFVDQLYSSYEQTYALHEDSLESWGNAGFVLGSDEYGRDILTRLVHGGLISLVIGLPACVLSCVLSIFFGLASGYYGGKIDHIIMRLSECISSIPFLPLIVTLSVFLMKDTSAYVRIGIVMLLYGGVSWTALARLIRTKVLVEKQKDYILYEKVIGASHLRILLKHILPSTISILVADITLLYASTLLIEASLSFLGFGVPTPYPSWGNMLQGAQTMQVIQLYWWQWFFAMFCVILSILSIHIIGETIRKEVNPKE